LDSYLTKVRFDIFVINYLSSYFNIGYSAIVSRNFVPAVFVDGINAMVKVLSPMKIANS
jgi:hypothetical protein